MAVVGTAQPIESSGSFGNAAEYTVTYQVITDSAGDGPAVAQGATGIPSRGVAYSFGNESDPFCFAESATAKLVGVEQSRKQWHVTVTFKHPSLSEQKDESTAGQYQDPVDMGWKISGSFASGEVPAIRDIDGNLIENSAKQLFINPPLMTDGRMDTLVLQKNTPNISLSLRAYLRGRVNGGPLWGLDARQVKLVRWDYQILYYGAGIPYVANTWEFLIKSQQDPEFEMIEAEIGWTDKIIDRGTRFIRDVNADDIRERYQAVMINDHEAEANLDGNGGLLEPDGDPHWLTFKVEPEVNFGLYFPDPLPGPFV